MRKTRVWITMCFCLFAAAFFASAQSTRKPGLWEMTTTMTWQQSPMPPGAQAPPGAAFGGGGNRGQALRAILQGRRRLFGLLGQQMLQRHHDEEVHRRRDQEKTDHRVDEVAVEKLTVVDLEGERREVGLADDRRDQRRDQVLHERRDDRAECPADDHRHRQIDDVAAQNERLETL